MKKIIVIISLVLVLISCSNNPTASDNQLKLIISPSELNMNNSDVETVSINIEDAEDLFIVSMEIVFEDEIIGIDEFNFIEGDFWSGSTISYSVLDTGRYSVFVGLQQTSESDGISGNGILFSFPIIAQNSGSTNIALENISLLDEDGKSIDGFEDLEVEGLSISVDLD
ncbi:MAG: hypothetical protein DRH79_01780 [Candidatus Cloacimonadota bacterium]|nr:MAG: hypothetical protein DRH79_01780 [Candidatus Cloacimonadota bacterium]